MGDKMKFQRSEEEVKIVPPIPIKDSPIPVPECVLLW